MDEKVFVISLKEPLVTLGGQTLTELTADFSKIKTRDLAQINRLERRLRGGSDGEIDAANLTKVASNEFRIGCTWVACMRGTKGLVLDDIDGLSLPDCLSLGDYSLGFLVRLGNDS